MASSQTEESSRAGEGEPPSQASVLGNTFLPRWKKAIYGLVISSIAMLPIYIVAEILYRRSIGVTWHLYSPSTNPAGQSVPPDNTDVMNFQSIHYYEIFQESSNPALGYEPKPGYSRGAVSINAHGFRDREFPKKKPAGTTRIVVLGDSIVWGHGLHLEDTFPKQLEKLLNDRMPGRYEALNFGVSGYSLQQEVEMFIHRASKFEPDILILGLCVNDNEYSSVEGDFFRRQAHGLFAKSYLLERASKGWNRILHRRFGVPPRYLEGIVDIDFHFQRLREASAGVKSLVLMFPQLYDLENYPAELHRYHDILTTPAEDHGFPVRDLLEDFRRHPAEEIRLDLIHPNQAGHAIAAQAALEALTDAGILPADDFTK